MRRVRHHRNHTSGSKKKVSLIKILGFFFVLALVVIISVSLVNLLRSQLPNNNFKSDIPFESEIKVIFTSQILMESLFEACYHDLYISRTRINRQDKSLFINLSHDREYILELSDQVVNCTEKYFIDLNKQRATSEIIVDNATFPDYVELRLLDLSNETINQFSINIR